MQILLIRTHIIASHVERKNISMKKIIKSITAVLGAVCLSICTVTGYYANTLPDSYYAESGEELSLNTALAVEAVSSETELAASRTLPATNMASLRLFGVIPIKNVEVINVDTPMLTAGGYPFGIKLLMDGVMVIKLGEIETSAGMRAPAAEAGIHEGDVIISLNGKKVFSNEEIQKIIAESGGEPVEIKLMRGGDEISLLLKPVHCEAENVYKAAMWVRDSSAGIGTITFYEPSSGCFGGLGHPVCDGDTGEILPLSKGDVVDVNICGVKKGFVGVPGELQGNFVGDTIGSLYLNNRYGVFGKLNESLPEEAEEIPMGLKQDAEVGEATILSTIGDGAPGEYSINIEKISGKSKDNSKNMVIRVTDKELLEKTGGIVQGMSGSPIIQNGRLIGAVTHVFVNDPSKGYAIFCENMYAFTEK